MDCCLKLTYFRFSGRGGGWKEKRYEQEYLDICRFDIFRSHNFIVQSMNQDIILFSYTVYRRECHGNSYSSAAHRARRTRKERKRTGNYVKDNKLNKRANIFGLQKTFMS